jgi:hypothetical protein
MGWLTPLMHGLSPSTTFLTFQASIRNKIAALTYTGLAKETMNSWLGNQMILRGKSHTVEMKSFCIHTLKAWLRWTLNVAVNLFIKIGHLFRRKIN